MPHERNIYDKESDMEKATMCTYTQSDHALPHWKYVLLCFADCPCIDIPDKQKNKKIKKQHSQLGFTFITSSHVVLIMIEFN